jgi:S1-C subfamily serine protease
MDQLIEFGEVQRGVLGVTILSLNADYRKSLGLADDVQGALVSQVLEGSAAATAGIEAGDVIVSVDGKPVKGSAELRNMIGMARIGDTVELGIIREGKSRKVKAEIAERSELTAEASELHPALAGADLGDATSEQTPGGGVLVRSVEPGSPASRIGLRANDIIVGVDRTRVTGLRDFVQAIEERETFLLSIRRGRQTVILPVQ